MKKISEDMDGLMDQTSDLLDKTNDLMTDVNGKMKTLDPVVKAAADLGESVSELNDSSKKIAKRFSSNHLSRTGLISSIAATAFARRKRRRGEN